MNEGGTHPSIQECLEEREMKEAWWRGSRDGDTKERRQRLTWSLIEPVTLKVSIITHPSSNALVYSQAPDGLMFMLSPLLILNLVSTMQNFFWVLRELRGKVLKTSGPGSDISSFYTRHFLCRDSCGSYHCTFLISHLFPCGHCQSDSIHSFTYPDFLALQRQRTGAKL